MRVVARGHWLQSVTGVLVVYGSLHEIQFMCSFCFLSQIKDAFLYLKVFSVLCVKAVLPSRFTVE